MALISPEIYAWVILPVLIFTARVLDVSLGTVRIIFISRGMKLLAPLVGFFEVMIWILAIAQIMQDLTNAINYFAFAGGFALGNFVGIEMEDRLAMGLISVWIITRRDATHLINHLKNEKYGITSVAAEGVDGQVRIIFTIIKRKNLRDVLGAVNEFNPRAFISTADIRSASDAILPPLRSRRISLGLIRRLRKEK